MNSFLIQVMRARCALFFVIIPLLTFTLDVYAQTDPAKDHAAVATMQVTTTKAKPMPAKTSLKNICTPARMKTRQQENVLTVDCQPSSPSASANLKAKPAVQRSDINCKYTENDQGGLDVDSCKCKADSDSNCTNFITWCAKQGGDVGGNNQSATCG